MASEFFPHGLKQILEGAFDLESATLRARLVQSGVEGYNAAASNMSGYTSIGTDFTMTTNDLAITVSGADVVIDVVTDATFNFGSPAGTTTCGAFVIYNFNSDDNGSTPIMWIEFANKDTDGSLYEVDINAAGLGTIST